MDYIINPWVFYWIYLLDKLDFAACVTTFLSLSGAAVCFLFGMDLMSGDYEEENYKPLFKATKLLMLLGVTALAATIITPDKETMMQMLVAKSLTYQNITGAATSTADTVKEIVDYIIQAYAAVK